MIIKYTFSFRISFSHWLSNNQAPSHTLENPSLGSKYWKLCKKLADWLPGVGGVEPREFDDFEFNKLSMFDDELVLLHAAQTQK